MRSGGKQTQGLHTTEQPAMQSVLEVNDLTELMTMVSHKRVSASRIECTVHRNNIFVQKYIFSCHQ